MKLVWDVGHLLQWYGMSMHNTVQYTTCQHNAANLCRVEQSLPPVLSRQHHRLTSLLSPQQLTKCGNRGAEWGPNAGTGTSTLGHSEDWTA